MGRFVRPEAIEGTRAVTRVFDQVHVVHRACRAVEADASSLDEIRDRLRRLARVTHPHLARLVAVGEDHARLMVVSEWLPGGPLARSHIPNPGRLLPGVAEALYALHRHGLAHGSISASSFVLDGNNVVKLVDSCVAEGSVPEDIEAFGAAMEALYLGREMPPELAQVARDARNGRFGDATLLAQAVQAVCAELPPVANTEEGPPPPPKRPTSEQKENEERPFLFWLLLASIPAVLLIWVAMGVGLWLGPNPQQAAVAPAPAAPSPAPHEVGAVAAPVEGGPVEAGPVEAGPVEGAVEAPPVAVASSEGHEIEPGHAPMPAPYVEGMHAVVAPVPGGGEASLFARVVVPPPEPPPAPPPAGGAWRKSVVAGDPHPQLTLVLDATNTVADRVDRKGRPRIEIRCANHHLSVTVQPGVMAVERIQNEVGFEATTAMVKLAVDGGATSSVTARMPKLDESTMLLPNPGSFVRSLASTGVLELSYTPFASDAVVANFATQGLATYLGDIRENCAL